jgi:hypothetical protein
MRPRNMVAAGLKSAPAQPHLWSPAISKVLLLRPRGRRLSRLPDNQRSLGQSTLRAPPLRVNSISSRRSATGHRGDDRRRTEHRCAAALVAGNTAAPAIGRGVDAQGRSGLGVQGQGAEGPQPPHSDRRGNRPASRLWPLGTQQRLVGFALEAGSYRTEDLRLGPHGRSRIDRLQAR